MGSVLSSEVPSVVSPLLRPIFTDQEIRAVREGINGVKGMIPARCYHDPAFYEFELEHVLKKNWLCVGRWDWAEKPGDYYTLEMLGEPIVIIRDRQNKLIALVNVCQHRWAQVAPTGRGHTKLLVCPYHGWTYELDGRLRGISIQDAPNVDKKNCRMPSLRVEEWQGMVFINFDHDAAPLAPQLEGATKLIERYGLDKFRTAGRTDYNTTWNYKFSFETGYEAYHHEGVHKTLLPGTAIYHKPLAFGKLWGAYSGSVPTDNVHPFGTPPWMPETEASNFEHRSIFIGVYPNLITYIGPHQISFITTELLSVTANRATTSIAIAPWALERPNGEAIAAKLVDQMKAVQAQDTDGCRMLQGGIRSKYNTRSIIHPLESQLSHYYNWLMDQYLA